MSKKLKNKRTQLHKAIYRINICLVSALLCISCGDGIVAPDVSSVAVDVDIIRFDQLFQGIDTLNITAELADLEAKHPTFTPLFYKQVLPLIDQAKPSDASLLAANISKYINDEFVQNLYDTVQIVFPNLNDIKTELEESVKYLKHYFPEKGDYNVYAFVSEFGFQTFILDDVGGKEGLGLGLDMFLGIDYPYKSLIIQNASFSDYITRSFNKDHIVKKLMDAIIIDLANVKMGERLIDKMISAGKRQYLLDKVLPYTSDTIKWEYSKAQMDWVRGNEVNIYVHVLSEDLLYETSTKKIKSLIDLSPSSKGMPPESPGRTANYIGYKIVDKFMSRTNITLDSLIRIKDAQFILDNSRYKPLNK